MRTENVSISTESKCETDLCNRSRHVGSRVKVIKWFNFKLQLRCEESFKN